MNKISKEKEKNVIEVQVQQHKKMLNIIIIILFILTINMFIGFVRLNNLINILDNVIQKFVSIS